MGGRGAGAGPPGSGPAHLCSTVCGCSPTGTLPEGCDEAGRCLCRPGFDGPHCDRCHPGYHGYPDCRGEQRGWGPGGAGGTHGCHGLTLPLAACSCDPRGALDEVCGAGGLCRCRPGYTGAACQECSPGHHGFPACARKCPRGRRGGRRAPPHTHPLPVPPACHCSADGSLHAACDPRSGQCSCRPRVTGLRCDACVPGTYNFPACEGEAGAACVACARHPLRRPGAEPHGARVPPGPGTLLALGLSGRGRTTALVSLHSWLLPPCWAGPGRSRPSRGEPRSALVGQRPSCPVRPSLPLPRGHRAHLGPICPPGWSSVRTLGPCQQEAEPGAEVHGREGRDALCPHVLLTGTGALYVPGSRGGAQL